MACKIRGMVPQASLLHPLSHNLSLGKSLNLAVTVLSLGHSVQLRLDVSVLHESRPRISARVFHWSGIVERCMAAAFLQNSHSSFARARPDHRHETIQANGRLCHIWTLARVHLGSPHPCSQYSSRLHACISQQAIRETGPLWFLPQRRASISPVLSGSR
jgi:hypothetical protein